MLRPHCPEPFSPQAKATLVVCDLVVTGVVKNLPVNIIATQKTWKIELKYSKIMKQIVNSY